MKKFCLSAAVLTAFSLSAFAQTRAPRVFDNFDTSAGVQVHVKPVEPPVKAIKSNKKKEAANQQTGKFAVQTTALQRAAAEPSLKMSAGKSLGNFSTGNSAVDNYILNSAARHNVDPLLVYATMSQESGFKPGAISYKGARGLMQLMPATAVRFGVRDIFDPAQNIDAGVKYLRWLLDTFNGDVRLALAGYNAGEGAVMKYGYAIPPYSETQNYVRRISARYEMLRNPALARNVVRAATIATETAKLDAKKSAQTAVQLPPLPPLYEPSISPIRLPNGKVQLVTQ